MCPEGYNCDDFAISNITSRHCPSGHWCPLGTSEPRKCPPGTYFNETGAVNEFDCLDCPAGNYCPEGSSFAVPCSPGHYCEPGASAQVTCPGGYYCNSETFYLKKECPINFYCERGSSAPVECNIDDKYICEYKTEVPTYCGPGFEVIDKRKYQSPNFCKPCLPGYYSDYVTDGCQLCPAGYACYGYTNTAKPTLYENHKGEKCPKGHYCPIGTYEPLECTPGTFNPEEGKEKIEDCQLCAPGTF